MQEGEIMKTIIYFFTGTGNSLYIAKKLAEKLSNCELVPISKIWQQDSPIVVAERIGLIFPVYGFGLPAIVYEFLNKLNTHLADYIFTIITSGGGSSGASLSQVKKLLKKQSKRLNAGFSIQMPINYIPMYNIPSEGAQIRMFEKASIILNNIYEVIKSNQSKIRREPFSVILKPINKLFRNRVNKLDKDFYVNINCDSCEICEKVCPVGNIKIVDGKPEWQHKCQQCLACIHFCPQKAIQYGKNTANRERYHQPQIKIKEIMSQNS